MILTTDPEPQTAAQSREPDLGKAIPLPDPPSVTGDDSGASPPIGPPQPPPTYGRGDDRKPPRPPWGLPRWARLLVFYLVCAGAGVLIGKIAVRIGWLA